MPNVINPYIAGNPISAAGSDMFFGREKILDSICQTLIGRQRDHAIVLYGQRRVGKTSILCQLPGHLGARYLCILVDIHDFALEGLSGFLWELAKHIVQSLRHDHHFNMSYPSRTEFISDARSFFENEFLDQIFSVIGNDRQILLMFDEVVRLQEQVQAGNLDPEVFEYLRHLMQHSERLNFVFSLGSGLEEMTKEYSFLFSVALQKKISYLEKSAAIALITQPIRDCYKIEPAAVDRILSITSGYAYHTQLICHCLFSYWQRESISSITAQDVDEILDEAVELGSAVLTYVWADSTPCEKAVMAGVVAMMADRNDSVKDNAIYRIWNRYNVHLPQREVAKAIQSLITREVIIGREAYTFTIDLQRLWIYKHKHLEWVKEEIADAVIEWSHDAPRANLLSRRTVIGGSAGLVLIAIGSGVAWWIMGVPRNLLYTYHGHSDLVTSVVWSPNGERIASGSYDHTIQVWDSLSGNHNLTYRGHNDVVTAVAWSPNGRYIASGSDNSVQIWNATNGGHILTYNQGLAAPIAWSPDSTHVAINGPNFTVQVWRALDGTHISNCTGMASYINRIAWSPNGEYIASGGADSTVWIWDAANAKPLLTYHGHNSRVNCITWSPDSGYIASASDDSTVRLWNVANGNTNLIYRGHSGSVRSTAWSSNGQYIASGGTDGTVQVWSPMNGNPFLTYRGNLGIVRGIAWSPDSKLIASCGDPTVQVWKPL